MSLISEDVTVVGQGLIDVTCLTYLTPPITAHMSLLTGMYKQAVGYVAPRTEEWNYVLDVNTNEPLRLPNGYLPISVAIRSVQNLPDDSSFQWYYVDAPTDPANANYFGGTSWSGLEINNKTYYEDNAQGVGLNFDGYNWIVFQNDNFPTTVSTGVMKVVVEYM